MSEMRFIIVQLVLFFNAFVLQLPLKVCTANRMDYQDVGGMGSENDPKQLITRLFGKDVGKGVTDSRTRHPPSYLQLLYNSLEDSENITPESNSNTAQIRSFRGMKGERNHFRFPLENIQWSDVNRMEIVLKITDKLRWLEQDPTLNVTLPVYIGDQDPVSVWAELYDDFLIFSLPSPLTYNDFAIHDHLIINEEMIRISKPNQPLLLLYEHLSKNPLLSGIHRSRRHSGLLNDLIPHSVTSEPSSCRKQTWYINMGIFDINWWIAPVDYNAGICTGTCRFPLTQEGTNSTSYSFMKNIWFVQTFFVNPRIPRANCVPIEYDPLQILYVNSNIETSVMIVADMKVKHCGCR